MPLELGSRCVLRPEGNPALCIIVGLSPATREWILEITGPRLTDYRHRQLVRVPVDCEDLIERQV